MSILLMTRVWTSAEPREAADRLMLLALADNANDEGVCWPSVVTLARKCASSRRSALETLARLEAAGHIVVERTSGRVNRYHVAPAGAVGRTGAVDRTGAVGDTGAVDDTGTDAVGRTSPVRWTAPEPTRTTSRTVNNNTRTRGRTAVDAPGTSAPSMPGVVVGDDGVIELLAERGVALGTAGSLALAHGAARCREAVRVFDADAQAGKAHTAGWLVKAIRSGWTLTAPEPRGALLSYAEMLSECERTGRTTASYEAVRIEGHEKPMWRVRPVASTPDGSGDPKRPSESAGPGEAPP